MHPPSLLLPPSLKTCLMTSWPFLIAASLFLTVVFSNRSFAHLICPWPLFLRRPRLKHLRNSPSPKTFGPSGELVEWLTYLSGNHVLIPAKPGLWVQVHIYIYMFALKLSMTVTF
jgi:hypothetical protein